jgi:hypothetical protein
MLLVAAVLSTAAVADPATQFSKQVPVGPQDRVSVSNVAGSVAITTWDRREVDVQGELGSGIERVDVRQESGSVDIRVVIKEGQGGWRNYEGWKNSEARLQIRLPADVPLEINTVSAPIAVAGVRGRMRLKSVSGEIRSDVAGTDVEAKTISGNIELTGSSAKSRVRASSISGNVNLIRVVGDVESRSISGKLDLQVQGADNANAQTVSGDIGVRGPLGHDGNLDLASVSGRIKVAAQAPGGFKYDVSTFGGSISSCFGGVSENTKSWGGTHLYGTQGDGKASVRVKSHSGNVELCDH